MSDKGSTFLLPEQVDDLRTACYDDEFQPRSQQRNEAIIQTLYDTGLRSVELTRLETSMFNGSDGTLWIPKRIQKQFSQGEPIPTDLELSADTVRLLKSHLSSRSSTSERIFTSRVSNSMTTESVRQMTKKVARAAEVEPRKLDPEQGWVAGTPDDVSPHIFRHSVAYRMLRVEERDIYDVKNRLRHRKLETTMNRYAHFESA